MATCQYRHGSLSLGGFSNVEKVANVIVMHPHQTPKAIASNWHQLGWLSLVPAFISTRSTISHGKRLQIPPDLHTNHRPGSPSTFEKKSRHA